MVPRREALTQLARLVGGDEFTSRFGSPRTADPGSRELGQLVDERLDEIVAALAAEAVANDDVLDAATAMDYLDDRLRMLADVLTEAQAKRIARDFERETRGW